MILAPRMFAVALMSGAMVTSTAAESQACCFSNWFGCGGARTTYRPLFPWTGYYGGGGGGACCNTCQPACSPCQQSCQYAPVTCYRTQSVCRPVAVCRPVTVCDPCTGCPHTVMRPTTTYVRQTYRVPYTTYRLTAAPASNCCGTSSYYSPASSYAPSSGCCGSGATYSSDTYSSGTVIESSPGSSSTIVRPGPATEQPALDSDSDAGGEATYEESSTRSRVRLQPPIPDVDENRAQDRTTSMPILRASERVAASEPATVVPAQHVRPLRKKLDDGGWRSARN